MLAAITQVGVLVIFQTHPTFCKTRKNTGDWQGTREAVGKGREEEEETTCPSTPQPDAQCPLQPAASPPVVSACAEAGLLPDSSPSVPFSLVLDRVSPQELVTPLCGRRQLLLQKVSPL